MSGGIDWPATQRLLSVTPDGIPGPQTYAALFRVVGPLARPEVLQSLGHAAAIHFPRYGITDSIPRLADIIAQGANETGGFTVWEENLHYSAARIHAVWPKRFPTVESATPFAWDPTDPDREDIALADRVYGDRMGNQVNGLNDDDGWESRGMGYLMMTGLANRAATNKRLGIGLDLNPELAKEPALSLLIACDFYQTNGVLRAIDEGDLIGARRITNVGDRHARMIPIGWDNVQALRAKVLTKLL